MKAVARVVVVFAALVLVAALALPFLIDVNQFRPRLESELTTAVGRPVNVGNLKLQVFSGSVGADNLSIADDPAFSQAPFLSAKSLSAGIDLMPLIFSRRISVRRIVIDQPEIALLQKPTGEWNYAKLGGAKTSSAPASSGPPVDLSVDLVRISNGRLTIAKTSRVSKPLVLSDVNLELTNFSRTTVFPFSLSAKFSGGGDINMKGSAGPISAENVELTPLKLTLNATHLDLVESAALDPAAGIAGLVAIDASGDSDGKRIELNGKVTAEKLQLVKGASPATRPAEFDFTLRHDLASRAGSLIKGEIHIGKAQAALTGMYTPQGESMAIKATLSGTNMPVQELEGMLPALNVVLPDGAKLESGAASINMSVEGPLANLSEAGSLRLNGVRIAGFDLGKKMTAIEALAGIKNTPTTEIQTLSSDVKNGSAGTELDKMKLVETTVGELDGSGTVSPQRALDLKMRVMLKEGLLPAALGARSKSGVPFFIRGTSSDPKFEPDLKGMAESEMKDLKGAAGKAAGGILNGLLGGKKKD